MHHRSTPEGLPQMPHAIRPRSSAVATTARRGSLDPDVHVDSSARRVPGLGTTTSPIVDRGIVVSRTTERVRRFIDHIVPVLAARLLVSLLVSAVAPGAVVFAQGGSSAQSTAVREGTCAEPGDVVALLEAVPTRAAMAQHVSVSTSVTDVMLPLADLAAEPHAIVVRLPDGGFELCGAVGGMPVDDGLAIPLATTDGEIAGIAWLRELGREATTIHVFVVAAPIEPMVDVTPAPEGPSGPSASPSPRPTATPEPEAVPGEEIDPREDSDVDVVD